MASCGGLKHRKCPMGLGLICKIPRLDELSRGGPGLDKRRPKIELVWD